jgi:hypothetical protein
MKDKGDESMEEGERRMRFCREFKHGTKISGVEQHLIMD